MNGLDILLAAILATSVVAGFVKGFARSAVGLFAVLLGLMGGMWFYGPAGAVLLDFVSSRQLANIIGFFLIFFGVLLLGALASTLLAWLLKWAHLSWLDRLAGGGFGLLRGALIGAVIVLAVMAFSYKPPPRSVVGSRLAPYVVGTADMLAAAAPYELKEGFRRSYELVEKFWAEEVKRRVPPPSKPEQER